MRRAFPWILSVILLIAFGASFSELQRVRKRFGEITRHTFHDHQDVRRFIIKNEIDQNDGSIVVLGDSITEMTRLPEKACGRTLINGGIGGATTSDLIPLSRVIFRDNRPAIVILALGANDGRNDDLDREIKELVSTIGNAKIAVTSVTRDRTVSDKIRAASNAASLDFYGYSPTSFLEDGIHYDLHETQRFRSALLSLIQSIC